MSKDIKFGTDGWRGVIADDYTFENVRRAGGAIAAYVLKNEDWKKGIVVGYDTRYGSRWFAEAISEVITDAGIPVKLANDYTPTPAISYCTKHWDTAGGVAITSSHNPYMWNGVKFKEKFGGSARPSVIKQIEAEIAAGAMPKGTKAKIEEVDLKAPHREAITQVRRSRSDLANPASRFSSTTCTARVAAWSGRSCASAASTSSRFAAR